MSTSDRNNAWCFRALGIREDADEEDIQNAYRRMVMAWHPDVNKREEAPVRFREIVEAYGTLMEAIKLNRASSGERIVERAEKDETIRSMSLEELEHRLVHSVSPQVRATAAAAAGLKGGAGARSLLTRALNDSDECVRNVSMIMLGRIGRAGDVPSILGSLVRNGGGGSVRTAGRLLWKELKNIPGGLAGSGLTDGGRPAGAASGSRTASGSRAGSGARAASENRTRSGGPADRRIHAGSTTDGRIRVGNPAGESFHTGSPAGSAAATRS